MTRTTVAALALLAVIGTACTTPDADSPRPGGAPTTDAPVPGPSGPGTGTPGTGTPGAEPPTTEVPSTPEPTAITVDWGDRPGHTDLGGGWVMAGCEGDAPLLCIEDVKGGRGLVELLVFPADPSAYPERDGSPERFASIAREATEANRSDRVAGCPEGYRFTADEPRPATVAGGPGIRIGFSIHEPSGTLVERSTVFLTVRDHALVIIGAEGLSPTGCVFDDEFAGFTPDALVRFGATFDRLAAGSILPD